MNTTPVPAVVGWAAATAAAVVAAAAAAADASAVDFDRAFVTPASLAVVEHSEDSAFG